MPLGPTKEGREEGVEQIEVVQVRHCVEEKEAVNDRKRFFTETQKPVYVTKNNINFCFCRIMTETDYFCQYR